jgi:hypothetical protein
MKSFLLAVLLSSVFAMKGSAQNIPLAVNQSFSAEFPSAEKAEWTATGKLYKAEFIQEEEKHFAFFNNSGELVAQSKYIQYRSLPQRLKYELVKQFPDYNITDLFEVTNDTDKNYYVILEKNGISLVLKSWQNRRWETFQK